MLVINNLAKAGDIKKVALDKDVVTVILYDNRILSYKLVNEGAK